MATSPIDINAMVTSIYSTIMNVQKSAEDLVGLDTLWCRAVPHKNGEDVILQEYTLTNVECPQPLRVIQDKSDYQPGTFSLEMFGMSYENPLEISINIDSWKQVFGENTAPQKGDILLIKAYNRLYEVASMTVFYMMQSIPQYYKCTLTKYQRKASRKESEELRVSIDELTNSQDILFGKDIENEVADTVMSQETSTRQSTHVDPIKSCDLYSIITEDVYGKDGNFISPAYYNYEIAKQNVIFNELTASYQIQDNDINTHWIFSTWFRYGHNASLKEDNNQSNNSVQFVQNSDMPIELLGLHYKDKSFYYFKFKTSMRLKVGDVIKLSRGTLFNFSGEIDNKECENGLVIKIAAPDVLAANKKAKNWWSTLKNGWRIQKLMLSSNNNEDTEIHNSYNLLNAYSAQDKKIEISTDTNIITIKFNNIKKTIPLKKQLDKNSWYYICIDFNLNKIGVKLMQLIVNEKTMKISDKKILDKVYNTGNIKGFEIDTFTIENKGLDMNQCNIRLYESEYEMGENYKIDMYTELTRNASKLILIDNPLPAITTQFVSTLK